MEKQFEGCFVIQSGGWHMIDQLCCSLKCIRPIGRRHLGIGEKSETCFNKVTMSSFRYSILLWSVGSSGIMTNVMNK